MLFSYHDPGSVCWSEICQQTGLDLPVLCGAVNYGNLRWRHPKRNQASQFSVSNAVIFLHGHLNTMVENVMLSSSTNYVSHSSQKYYIEIETKLHRNFFSLC